MSRYSDPTVLARNTEERPHQNRMHGPGGAERTEWAEGLLLERAVARVSAARRELDLAEAEEQAIRRLISVRKDLERR